MKVGILTFHYAHNYGAVLQCLALQHYLESVGHEVFVIDYQLPCIRDLYKPFRLSRISLRVRRPWGIRSLFHEFYFYSKRKQRYDAFVSFIEKYLNLKPYVDSELKKLDCVVVGSDQVWGKQHSGGWDNLYFGKNIKASNGNPKLVSYAASVGYRINESDKVSFKDVLLRFDAISVRELTVKEDLQSLVDVSVLM